MAGFYLFNQNNSGGYTVVDDVAGIGDYVFIWATSADGANKKAEEVGMFSLSYCQCCGERFYSAWEDDEPIKNGDSGRFFSVREDINIFFHLPSGQIKKAFIPNNDGRVLSVDYVWNEDIVKTLTSN